MNNSFILNCNIFRRFAVHAKMDIAKLCHTDPPQTDHCLQPPKTVSGMQVLQREAFSHSVRVPCLRVPENGLRQILKLLKVQRGLLLKMQRLKPVREVSSNATDDTPTPFKEILLHPLRINNWKSFPETITNKLEELQITKQQLGSAEVTLNYDNWSADEIFKAVLPGDGGLTSYSIIGHIVHLNLREDVLPFKTLIGEVLLDKTANCRTVVNKLQNIDNTYRYFAFELLAGEPEYQVRTKENGFTFEFDFSKVYWNPRLCTEHERLGKLLQPGDFFYDVFAGVGPFSVPAAKRCTVMANDLNPESYRWLLHNAKLNKVEKRLKAFQKDGASFIREDMREDWLQRWSNEQVSQEARVHIAMNLPAMAVEFLPHFQGLLRDCPPDVLRRFLQNKPMVHVYLFAKGLNTKDLVLPLVEKHLGAALGEALEGVHFVRNVAPNKDMYRVSFYLTKEYLCGGSSADASTAVDKSEPVEIEGSAKRKANFEQDVFLELNKTRRKEENVD